MSALSFNTAKTNPGREKVPSYKIREGENKVRFFGGIVGRYIYWIPGPDGTKSPVECLQFDRETQSFNNSIEDPVKKHFPDLKPEWAYASLCIDRKESEPKVCIFNHKKKLFNQIGSAVADLGDPSDPENGWTVVFDKKKVGPKVFNVEYQLNVLRCSKEVGPLKESERELFDKHPSIEEVLKRPTAADIEKYITEVLTGGGKGKSGQESVDEEIPDEINH
jgi:hypothetical protein